jgi:hypothetical protein
MISTKKIQAPKKQVDGLTPEGYWQLPDSSDRKKNIRTCFQRFMAGVVRNKVRGRCEFYSGGIT